MPRKRRIKKNASKAFTAYPGMRLIKLPGKRGNSNKFKGPDDKLYHEDKRSGGGIYRCATRSTQACSSEAFHDDDKVLQISDHSLNRLQNKHQQASTRVQNKKLREELKNVAKSNDDRPNKLIVEELKAK